MQPTEGVRDLAQRTQHLDVLAVELRTGQASAVWTFLRRRRDSQSVDPVSDDRRVEQELCLRQPAARPVTQQRGALVTVKLVGADQRVHLGAKALELLDLRVVGVIDAL